MMGDDLNPSLTPHHQPKMGPHSLNLPQVWASICWTLLDPVPRASLHLPVRVHRLLLAPLDAGWGGGGGHGGRSWSGPDPKGGGGPPPLRTPKLSHGTRCFVGAGGAGDFVLGIRQGEFFLFHPMCLYSKYSEFCGEFKNG